jgi:hypothetical protein
MLCCCDRRMWNELLTTCLSHNVCHTSSHLATQAYAFAKPELKSGNDGAIEMTQLPSSEAQKNSENAMKSNNSSSKAKLAGRTSWRQQKHTRSQSNGNAFQEG